MKNENVKEWQSGKRAPWDKKQPLGFSASITHQCWKFITGELKRHMNARWDVKTKTRLQHFIVLLVFTAPLFFFFFFFLSSTIQIVLVLKALNLIFLFPKSSNMKNICSWRMSLHKAIYFSFFLSVQHRQLQIASAIFHSANQRH